MYVVIIHLLARREFQQDYEFIVCPTYKSFFSDGVRVYTRIKEIDPNISRHWLKNRVIIRKGDEIRSLSLQEYKEIMEEDESASE